MLRNSLLFVFSKFKFAERKRKYTGSRGEKSNIDDNNITQKKRKNSNKKKELTIIIMT